ncbi:MAG: radical SAM family heme chaperone HemW [Bacteroidaceae bacterium]|nr:radical SAM family heme chaperone HemW [Bacteroidaceae bacterium]
MAGIYIHVPFCKSRCIYCDFYSTTFGHEWMAMYVSALEREMAARSAELNQSCIETLYLGGGTPSQLPLDLLQSIFRVISQHACFSKNAEVTIEVNPDDVTLPWLDGLRQTPVNRISMGVQTFDDGLLRFLQRRHNGAQACNAISNCLKFGYTNISIDLIYGLPKQTMALWQHDLDVALSEPITHLSAYSLSFESGTKLAHMLEQGDVMEADEELSLQMYLTLLESSRQAGFEHYEISNFCRPGFHSRHNSSYWQQIPYYGFGPGAHSYDGYRTRRWNDCDLIAYISSKGDVPHSGETLSDKELYDEFVMTGLRTRNGIELCKLSSEDAQYCVEQAQSHLKAGRMVYEDGKLRISDAGIFVSNDIISDLMR